MRYWVALLLLTSNLAQAQQYTLDTTPNPKVENNTYVSDPTHILEQGTVTTINLLLDSIERNTTAQVAVVMLPSIGDADVVEFSQSLFEKWGIGQRNKDNGLLILFVQDQRTIRFHTGYGLEGVLPDITCKRIQQEFMVPYFKKEDINKGMLEGVKVVGKILTDPESTNEIYDSSPRSKKFLFLTIVVVSFLYGLVLIAVFANSWKDKKFKQTPEAPNVTISVGWWLSLYLVIPAAFFFYHNTLFISSLNFLFRFYLLLVLFFVERFVRILLLAQPFANSEKHHELYNYFQRQKGYWKGLSFLFPIPLIAFYFFLLARAKTYRNKPRTCKNCGNLSEKLSEQEDDIALNTGQQTEEKVKSVDYDVWKCKSCGSLEILCYINADTKYTACQKCAFVTSSLSERRTLTPATYSNEGAGEEEYICTYCGHHHIVPFVIAKLVESSSSSGGSSDSSSSFGGGDSGGGGASSSW